MNAERVKNDDTRGVPEAKHLLMFVRITNYLPLLVTMDTRGNNSIKKAVKNSTHRFYCGLFCSFKFSPREVCN